MRTTRSVSRLRAASLLLTLAVGLALPGCSNEKPRLFSPNLVGESGSPLPQSARLRTIRIPEFLDGRTCWVYLPPGYSPERRRYPVLYMHDGQELWGPGDPGNPTWRLESTLDSLIGARLVAPLIVVGIRNADRLHEYTPFENPYYPEEGGGDEYLRAIRDHLKPAIDRYFATLPDAAHTLMAGSSLGGLISVYAGYAYDDVFGRIGGFSGSYAWNFRFFDFVESRRPNLVRLYLDSGTINDNSFSLSLMKSVALDQGFVEGQDLMTVLAQGHDHTPYYWGIRFPEAIQFMMGGIDPEPLP